MANEMPPEAVIRMIERDAVPAEEMTICPDCGIDAWWFEEDGRIVHEDFYVHDELWDATCPDDDIVRWTQSGEDVSQGRFVICIGCFEKRLGRRLTRQDFIGEPYELEGVPASRRYVDRWAASP